MKILTVREARVIRLRYGIETGKPPQTLQEIADRYNTSRERIRQIEARALRKLGIRGGPRLQRRGRQWVPDDEFVETLKQLWRCKVCGEEPIMTRADDGSIGMKHRCAQAEIDSSDDLETSMQKIADVYPKMRAFDKWRRHESERGDGTPDGRR